MPFPHSRALGIGGHEWLVRSSGVMAAREVGCRGPRPPSRAAVSWLLPGHPFPRLFPCRVMSVWISLGVHLFGTALCVGPLHGWMCEGGCPSYPPSSRVPERCWALRLRGKSCIYCRSSGCLYEMCTCAGYTGGGSGHRAEGRVSLRPPRGSDAAAGAAELPAGRVGWGWRVLQGTV